MAEKLISLPAKQELHVKADGQFSVYVGSGGIGMFVGPVNANARRLRIPAAREERDVTIRHGDQTTVYYESHHVNITEDLDDTPVEAPSKHRGSRSLQEQIRELVARELFVRARDDGVESLAEAEDFKLDPSELDDMLTPYEFRPMVEEAPEETPERPQGPPEPEVRPQAPPPAPTPSGDS